MQKLNKTILTIKLDIVFSIQPTHCSSEGLTTKIYEQRPKQM